MSEQETAPKTRKLWDPNPSAPVFDDRFYYDENDSKTLIGHRTNCLEWAMNSYDVAIADPGHLSGKFLRNANLMTSQHIVELSESDGMENIGKDFANIEIPEGKYAVALYFKLKEDGTRDYHWIRQNADGTWSGKDGTFAPYIISQDENGNITYNGDNPIKTPTEYFGHYKLETLFLIPEGGLDVGFDAFLERAHANAQDSREAREDFESAVHDLHHLAVEGAVNGAILQDALTSVPDNVRSDIEAIKAAMSGITSGGAEMEQNGAPAHGGQQQSQEIGGRG